MRSNPISIDPFKTEGIIVWDCVESIKSCLKSAPVFQLPIRRRCGISTSRNRSKRKISSTVAQQLHFSFPMVDPWGHWSLGFYGVVSLNQRAWTNHSPTNQPPEPPAVAVEGGGGLSRLLLLLLIRVVVVVALPRHIGIYIYMSRQHMSAFPYECLQHRSVPCDATAKLLPGLLSTASVIKYRIRYS